MQKWRKKSAKKLNTEFDVRLESVMSKRAEVLRYMNCIE